MVYYILLPGDSIEDAALDPNILGESSFNTFYAGSGLIALMHMVDQYPEILPDVVIKDEQSKLYTIEDFLTEIKNLNVRYE